MSPPLPPTLLWPIQPPPPQRSHRLPSHVRMTEIHTRTRIRRADPYTKSTATPRTEEVFVIPWRNPTWRPVSQTAQPPSGAKELASTILKTNAMNTAAKCQTVVLQRLIFNLLGCNTEPWSLVDRQHCIRSQLRTPLPALRAPGHRRLPT